VLVAIERVQQGPIYQQLPPPVVPLRRIRRGHGRTFNAKLFLDCPKGFPVFKEGVFQRFVVVGVLLVTSQIKAWITEKVCNFGM
jgi:hypothetical protein